MPTDIAGELTARFVFDNNPAALLPLSNGVISFLNQSVVLKEAVLQKVRLIVIEMLTNAVKHCNAQQSIIQIYLRPSSVVIKKTDTGKPLAITNAGLNWQWSLPGVHHCNTTINVYPGAGCMLMAALQTNCHLRFFVEERQGTEGQDLDVQQLSEHFGLMIVTRACDNFEYIFDIENCTNNFIARLSNKYQLK